MRPAFLEGTVLRDWYELSVRIEKVKREFTKVCLKYDRGAPMQRRQERGTK